VRGGLWPRLTATWTRWRSVELGGEGGEREERTEGPGGLREERGGLAGDAERQPRAVERAGGGASERERCGGDSGRGRLKEVRGGPAGLHCG
jgi:hypothetical protein